MTKAEKQKRLKEILSDPIFRWAQDYVLANKPHVKEENILGGEWDVNRAANLACFNGGMEESFDALHALAKAPRPKTKRTKSELRYE